MIALTAPTISMQMHRHAKYAQHSTLLPSQTIRLSQSCTAWHAAPAPRQRHNACSAAHHRDPQTCFHTHADITCTQPGARACTASQTRSPGTPSHRHVHGVRTGQTCALNSRRDSQNTREHFCRQSRENPASNGTCRGSAHPSPLHCKRSHLVFQIRQISYCALQLQRDLSAMTITVIGFVRISSKGVSQGGSAARAASSKNGNIPERRACVSDRCVRWIDHR